MRHDFLDRYGRLDSPVHRLPAGLKLVIALVIILTVVLLTGLTVWGFAALAGLLAVVALASRVPLGFLARRLLLLEPFVVGVAVLALLQPDGDRIFLLIVTKSTLCLFTMVLLSNTTPFAELLVALRRARLPALLITTLALMYRYLFVLVDEAERMRRARACRTFAKGRFGLWKVLGTVVGQLFVRSAERAERIYAAMCARGWK
ncbi:MAG TPA: cobalt ECF transporter T component CbiQ [Verrucomicrobiae bacterium]|nr:cobalt ECF transporter T component CbiQ [Verrucomicrobiae bacterium]